MSKETNLYTIEGHQIFEQFKSFQLIRIFEQNANFVTGWCVACEVHQGESIINKKSLFKSPIPNP